MAPSGARLPLSATSPPTGETGSSKGPDHRPIDPARGFLQPLGERAPLHVDGVEVQQRPQLPQQRAHAAGGMEVLHVALADGLEIDQHGRLVRELVEALQRES